MKREKLTKGKIIEILTKERNMQKCGKIKTRYGKRNPSKNRIIFSEELYRENTYGDNA